MALKTVYFKHLGKFGNGIPIFTIVAIIQKFALIGSIHL